VDCSDLFSPLTGRLDALVFPSVVRQLFAKFCQPFPPLSPPSQHSFVRAAWLSLFSLRRDFIFEDNVSPLFRFVMTPRLSSFFAGFIDFLTRFVLILSSVFDRVVGGSFSTLIVSLHIFLILRSYNYSLFGRGGLISDSSRNYPVSFPPGPLFFTPLSKFFGCSPWI